MNKIVALFLVTIAPFCLLAQMISIDTNVVYKVTVSKDPRLDILAKTEVDINIMATRFVKGYRLFVLKTNNRDYAMKVRSYLLQNFPDEKVIMSYQSPFIKIKFGNFEELNDAEKYKDLLIKAGIITGNIYVVPDTVELKPDRINKIEK